MQLQELADELLLSIVDQIDDRVSLCNLARTCSKLQLLSEPFIYKSVLVLKGSLVKDVLKPSFTARPTRLSAIKDLAIRYRFDSEEGIEDLEPFLYHMDQLRNLIIEAPCCNDTPWAFGDRNWESQGRVDYGKLFEASLSGFLLDSLSHSLSDSLSNSSPITPRHLANLQSLTLHSHNAGTGRSRFDLGENAIIFLHPTLRSIKLSCFNVGPDFPVFQKHHYQKFHKTTALKNLIFEECNISAVGLETILTLPKSLQRIALGERMYHLHDNPCKKLRIDSHALSRALDQQSESLIHLSHTGCFFPHFHVLRTPITHEFSILPNLKNLELFWNSFFIFTYFHHGMPPQLQSLKILGIPTVHIPDLTDRLDRMNLTIQALDIVAFVAGEPDSDAKKEEMIREVVLPIGKTYHKRNIDLRVYYIGRSEQQFIPPYMYGEGVPTEILAYSSSEEAKNNIHELSQSEESAESATPEVQ
ncbi:hypothetical protein HYFRA_00013772 [Hymenoscyphus fraxineus]|uniref:F-box domain-containing protein n=1 Tax=Hymenoscyphus fraxineus TaxID=746836 RepID=A0A9N9PVF8_9HELO|nr:hypothetical protein HYFRA_00013772 [Hymenoscyphus fraxineus]